MHACVSLGKSAPVAIAFVRILARVLEMAAAPVSHSVADARAPGDSGSVALTVSNANGSWWHSGAWRSNFRKQVDPVVETLDLDPADKLILKSLLVRRTDGSFNAGQWNKKLGNRLELIVLLGGILVSFGIMIQAQKDVQDSGYATVVFWVLMCISFLVNVAGAVQKWFSFSTVSDIHLQTFATVDAMTWEFFARTGRYTGMTHRDAFPHFVLALSQLQLDEANKIRATTVKAQQSLSQSAQGATAGFLTSAGVRPLPRGADLLTGENGSPQPRIPGNAFGVDEETGLSPLDAKSNTDKKNE